MSYYEPYYGDDSFYADDYASYGYENFKDGPVKRFFDKWGVPIAWGVGGIVAGGLLGGGITHLVHTKKKKAGGPQRLAISDKPFNAEARRKKARKGRRT
jgi:hypothetical protein